MIILSSRADRGKHAWDSVGAAQPLPRARVMNAAAARRLGQGPSVGHEPAVRVAQDPPAPALPEPLPWGAEERAPRWMDIDAMEAEQHRKLHWADALYEQSQAVKRDVACAVVFLAALSAILQLLA